MAGCATGGTKGRSLRGPVNEVIMAMSSFGSIRGAEFGGAADEFRLKLRGSLAGVWMNSPVNWLWSAESDPLKVALACGTSRENETESPVTVTSFRGIPRPSPSINEPVQLSPRL